MLVIVLCLGAIGWFGQHDKVNNALYRAYYGDHGIPAVHQDVYKEAAATYDVDWRLLAAVHRVETIFSHSSSMRSSVGAIGPFQFMPRTWLGWQYDTDDQKGDVPEDEVDLTDLTLIEQYGGLGRDGDDDGKADPHSLVDSAHAAAYYLSEHGGQTTDSVDSIQNAIFEYNRSDQYVSDVMSFYEQYQDELSLLPGDATTTTQQVARYTIRYLDWFAGWA
ncbi:lysozyme [Exiguobacterium sp. SH3S2]|nr:lysozyme [Exiguobacterium sp. SH5S4]TCI39862.1 lysozyme [Exiguobacterium sp. SH4S7]TCI42120.1 lysozyme [Exiguobacterium sp. SH3S3]TCI50295.1 lysozyme [Exiguobacterium sp. SH5S13]TCI58364.1 lysozyme [Exiguobacterium sp. SH3S2]TCI62825.1 lysozyme [Exiguobacterium sp. SH3S1]TCI65891.1 lysozyme [Exiguobacterium sp. SH0S2]TCI81058.1 lysozyme [Exiguobacterium sp. SH0S1]